MLNFDNYYVRSYRGYANKNKLTVLGHVLTGKNEKKTAVYQSSFKHAYNVIKMFFLNPIEQKTSFDIEFRGKRHTITTDAHGFFKQEVEIAEVSPGWHRYNILDGETPVDEGIFLQPCHTPYGIISDIDDTYLVSHTNNALQKIGVMLFRNVTKRKPFQDAVKHYRYLFNIYTNKEEKNVFFNVSSSEWNLFPLLEEFLQFHDFPNAVLLLDTMKNGFGELLFSGRGSHNHKLHKIEDIVTFYPQKKFILVGDDTQRDPYIYREAIRKFPDRFAYVQIRKVGKNKKPVVKGLLKELPIPSHYFETSKEAMEWLEKNVEN